MTTTLRVEGGSAMARRIGITAVLLMATLVSSIGFAQVASRKLCVFDPSGTRGDGYKFATRLQAEALAWGVRFELKAYTNEQVAAADFKTKQCDAALMTGTRGRAFVKSTATLEALGALPSYALLKSAIGVLASAKAGPLVTSGAYETVAIIPGGAIYLLVADRKIDTISELAGKKIATLTHDQAARTMVDVVGASMVAAEVGTFAGIFNNGRSDAAYAPANAFKPLELLKGIAKGGGIIRFPIAQMTFQVIVHKDRFAADFGGKARAWSSRQFNEAAAVAKAAEAAVPAKYWIEIPAADKPGYANKFREVRVRLRGKGVYDARMLKLMRKIRCRAAPTAPECKDKIE